jgi:hypothetical protein
MLERVVSVSCPCNILRREILDLVVLKKFSLVSRFSPSLTKILC